MPLPPLDPGSAAPRVKICGLTDVDEAVRCARLGADCVGLNFHPASPRFVDIVRARAIVEALPPPCVAVGLFVNRPPAEVAATAAQVGLGIVQLHGDEPPEDLLALAPLTIIRAFRLPDAAAIAAMRGYLERAETLGRAPGSVLVDGYVAGLAGGSGRTIDDDVLSRLPPLPRLILAGGLTPGNVAERVAKVRPWMVDVASGVESAPGRKDLARVAAFVRAARGSKGDDATGETG